VEPNHQTLNVD